MTDRPVTEFLDGIALDLDDDTMVTDIVLIAKTVDLGSGDVGLYIAETIGLSWLEEIGMLRAAERIASKGLGKPNPEDDE